MTINEAIRVKILAVTEVGAQVATRVYWERLPQRPVYPSVTYFRVATRGEESQTGDSNLDTALFEVKVYARTLAAATNLRDAIRLAFVGFRGSMDSVTVDGVFFEDEGHEYDDERECEIATLDVTVQFCR